MSESTHGLLFSLTIELASLELKWKDTSGDFSPAKSNPHRCYEPPQHS